MCVHDNVMTSNKSGISNVAFMKKECVRIENEEENVIELLTSVLGMIDARSRLRKQKAICKSTSCADGAYQ